MIYSSQLQVFLQKRSSKVGYFIILTICEPCRSPLGKINLVTFFQLQSIVNFGEDYIVIFCETSTFSSRCIADFLAINMKIDTQIASMRSLFSARKLEVVNASDWSSEDPRRICKIIVICCSILLRSFCFCLKPQKTVAISVTLVYLFLFTM